MSALKTLNLLLNKWVGTDNVKRAEIVENFDYIDAAFHATTGHKHDGTLGNGPKIPYANITGAPGLVAHKSTHAVGGSDALSPSDIGAMPAGSGNGTDVFIGSRTADQALLAPGNTGTITQLFSWVAGRLKAITGKPNWYDAPAATIEELKKYYIKKFDTDINDIDVRVEMYRVDATLAEKSVFSGGTSPLYTTRTVSFYKNDGVTANGSLVLTQIYNSDGVWKGETI